METYIIYDIVWDTDGEDVVLPDREIISVPVPFDDSVIADILSDDYGYCVESFRFKKI